MTSKDHPTCLNASSSPRITRKSKLQFSDIQHHNHQNDGYQSITPTKHQIKGQHLDFDNQLFKKFKQSSLPSTPSLTPTKLQSSVQTQITLSNRIQEDINRNQHQPTIYRSSQSFTKHLLSNEEHNLSVSIEHRSPYQNITKVSHKGHFSKHKQVVKHRKYQDLFERRIVNIINKLLRNKINSKQIQSLSLKMQKLTFKDLLNPYVISGLRTIGKLQLQNNQHFCSRYMEALSNLNSLIQEELDDISQYQESDEEIIPYKQVSGKLIRKVYSLLKEKNKNFTRQELQDKAINLCHQISGNLHIKVHTLLNFLRNVSK